MDTICPVCGVKLVESGGTILCPNRQCRHVSEWSQAAIEQADKTRARLIVEAMKPWRELIAEAVRDRITDDWLNRARVQLGQSESVKATSKEETT